jgi:hypothetical protein
VRMAMVMVNLPEGCSRLAGGLGGRMTNRQTARDESVHCAPGISVPPLYCLRSDPPQPS